VQKDEQLQRVFNGEEVITKLIMRTAYICISGSCGSLMFMKKLLKIILEHIFWHSVMSPWCVLSLLVHCTGHFWRK